MTKNAHREFISVIIPTLNRPRQLEACVRSLVANSYPRFEILIIDQSSVKITPSDLPTSTVPISIIPLDTQNKSEAINRGVSLSRGSLIALTDDDCIVSPSWVEHMSQAFQKHPQIAALYGKTLPYKSKLHPNETCPCTFIKATPSLVTTPSAHFTDIGYGNNVAIKKNVFKKIGGLKTWLGPGSHAYCAEDAELPLRMLLRGYTIYYAPSVTLWHNKWLNKAQLARESLYYLRGEMVCYGYFWFQHYRFATSVLQANVHDYIKFLKNLTKHILQFRIREITLGKICDIFSIPYHMILGLILAWWYTQKDPMVTT